MSPRRKKFHFTREPQDPKPIVVKVKSRVKFSEVDPTGVAWHGRYPVYFEEGFAELGRVCGLSYDDFHAAKLFAPIIEFHIDYFRPLYLNEEFTIETSLIWNDGARINVEYRLIKEDGTVASSGYTIELLTSIDGAPCIASPPLLNECRKRWKKGEFH